MATQRDQPVSGTADELRRLERFFRIFAATQCHGHSLVYERLSEEIAGGNDEPQRARAGRPARPAQLPLSGRERIAMAYLTAAKD